MEETDLNDKGSSCLSDAADQGWRLESLTLGKFSEHLAVFGYKDLDLHDSIERFFTQGRTSFAMPAFACKPTLCEKCKT